MCSDLRFIGPEESPPDFLTPRPNLSATVTPAGVLIPWKFDGYSKWIDVLRIDVDRSDGKGFVQLTYDTTPATPGVQKPLLHGYTGPPLFLKNLRI